MVWRGYRTPDDVVQDFFEERFFADPDSAVFCADAYKDFEAWWKENVGRFIPKYRRFRKSVVEKFEVISVGRKDILFCGFRISDGSDG